MWVAGIFQRTPLVPTFALYQLEVNIMKRKKHDALTDSSCQLDMSEYGGTVIDLVSAISGTTIFVVVVVVLFVIFIIIGKALVAQDF